MAKKLHTKPEKVLLGLLGVFSLMFLFTKIGQSLIYLFIAYVFPIYKSVLALESKKKEETQKWLSYWIILGFFYSFIGIIDRVLNSLFFPQLFKTLFFLYLYCPVTNGYIILYEMLIRRGLKLYENCIDKYLQMIDEEFKEKTQKIKQTIAQEIIKQTEEKKE